MAPLEPLGEAFGPSLPFFGLSNAANGRTRTRKGIDSPGDAAPIPPGLPISYKELNGGVWSAHTPNNWVVLTFG